MDSGLITTGTFADVTGTPFDFRTPTAIGARINDPDTVLQYGPGYDHNWVINKPLGKFGLMARVTDPNSGRVMEVWSDEPGLQFYAGNFLDGTLTGKDGKVYQRRSALLHGAAALSRFAEQAQLPLDRGTQARPDLSQHHRV